MNVLQYAMSLDEGGFTAPLGNARKALQDFGNLGNVMTGLRSSLQLMGGALRGMIAPIEEAVDKAADFETMRNQFITLLGSVEAAQQRMQELADFAANTPFELPDVVKASLQLERITNGALKGAENLTLVGDAASGAAMDLSQMSSYVAQLYNGITQGSGLGEAGEQFVKLGIVSKEAMKQAQALGKEGGWEIITAALKRYNGEMERQSFSWNGLMSTMRDSWAALQREFGQPLMNAFKPMLSEGIKLLDSLKEKAKELGHNLAFSGRMMIEAFKDGQLGTVLGLSLKGGVQEGINYLYSGFKATVAGGSVLLAEMFKGAVKVLTSREVWEGIGHTLKSIFYNILAFFKEGMADVMEGMGWAIARKAPGLRNSAEGDRVRAEVEGNIGSHRFEDANKKGYFDDFNKAIPEATDAFRKTWKASLKDPLFDADSTWGKLRGIMSKYVDSVRSSMSKEKQATDDREDKLAANRKPGEGNAPAARFSPPAYSGDNLSKIGGFIGGGNQALDHARRAANATEKTANGVGKLIDGVTEVERKLGYLGGGEWR